MGYGSISTNMGEEYKQEDYQGGEIQDYLSNLGHLVEAYHKTLNVQGTNYQGSETSAYLLMLGYVMGKLDAQDTHGNGIEGIEALLMPRGDGTGPIGKGKQDGSGGGNQGNQGGGGGGGNRTDKGQGSKTGGGKGGCK